MKKFWMVGIVCEKFDMSTDRASGEYICKTESKMYDSLPDAMTMAGRMSEKNREVSVVVLEASKLVIANEPINSADIQELSE